MRIVLPYRELRGLSDNNQRGDPVRVWEESFPWSSEMRVRDKNVFADLREGDGLWTSVSIIVPRGRVQRLSGKSGEIVSLRKLDNQNTLSQIRSLSGFMRQASPLWP